VGGGILDSVDVGYNQEVAKDAYGLKDSQNSLVRGSGYGVKPNLMSVIKSKDTAMTAVDS